MNKIAKKPFCCGWDFWLLLGLLVLINYPVFSGGNTDRWAFYPPLVKQGEWWRVITSFFAHVTWYHLLLDSLPFFLIYLSLDEKRTFYRLFYVVLAGTGSLLAGIWFSPQVQAVGLRGLSGITYGITTIGILEMVFRKERTDRIIGLVFLLVMLSMVTHEILTKKFLFSFLLFGMVGTPILVCHAGGMAGAIIAFIIARYRQKQL